LGFVSFWVSRIGWVSFAVGNSSVTKVLGKVDLVLLTDASWEFNPLVGFLFLEFNEGLEWEREMISINWKWSVLLIVPSVVLRARSSASAGGVEEENTMWSSRSVSWVKLSVLLLSNVMLRIQESVLGGFDDSIVDLWWLSILGLTGKFVSSGSICRKVVWQGLVWGILGVWIISSSSLTLAGGDDGVGQVILEWDGGVGSSLACAVGKFDPSSSDSRTTSRSSLGESNDVLWWVLNVVEFITLHGNIFSQVLVTVHTSGKGLVQLNGVDGSEQSG